MNVLRSIWWKVQDFSRDRWDDLRDFASIIGPSGWFLIAWLIVLVLGLCWGIRFADRLEKETAARIQRLAP